MREAARGVDFERQVFAGAETGVNIERNRERQFRLFRENRNLLRLTIFEELKIVFIQVRDGRPVIVGDRDEHVDQLDFDFNRVVVASIWTWRIRSLSSGVSRPWWLGDSGGLSLAQGGGYEQRREQEFHVEAIQLDAGVFEWLPTLTSSGNGSPSAQTAPSSKYSFFQIGTVRFSVSISQRQASNAAARWAAKTAIKTLLSPISIRPNRCTMAKLRMAKRWRASAASSPSFSSAMLS